MVVLASLVPSVAMVQPSGASHRTLPLRFFQIICANPGLQSAGPSTDETWTRNACSHRHPRVARRRRSRR